MSTIIARFELVDKVSLRQFYSVNSFFFELSLRISKFSGKRIIASFLSHNSEAFIYVYYYHTAKITLSLCTLVLNRSKSAEGIQNKKNKKNVKVDPLEQSTFYYFCVKIDKIDTQSNWEFFYVSMTDYELILNFKHWIHRKGKKLDNQTIVQ